MFGGYGNDLTGGETTKKENDNGSFTLFLNSDFGGDETRQTAWQTKRK